MLHSFDEPFSDDAGARVVSSFSFKQRSTHMASTLRSIVGLLDEAKHNLRMSSTRYVWRCRGGGRGELGVDSCCVWLHRRTQCLQLVFIISDGRLEDDRAAVRRWVREATERNQLVVLLIADSSDAQGSILSVKRIVRGGGAGGAGAGAGSGAGSALARGLGGAGFSVKAYMDDYPFPYYLVMRDARALPDALGDALRQWFELAAANS